MDYWEECIRESFGEAGIEATDKQIKAVVSAVEGAHDVYGEYHGHTLINDHRDPQADEIERLKKRLDTERSKVPCDACGGDGLDREIGYYPIPPCWKCKGDGRILRRRLG
jgi:hypothetical protein